MPLESTISINPIRDYSPFCFKCYRLEKGERNNMMFMVLSLSPIQRESKNTKLSIDQRLKLVEAEFFYGGRIMKEHFYYLRNHERQPIVTVCLLINEGLIEARGLAVCNPKDMPCKKTGQNISKGHAIQALTHHKSIHLIPKISHQRIRDCIDSGEFIYKVRHMGELIPVLTGREWNILQASKEGNRIEN